MRQREMVLYPSARKRSQPLLLSCGALLATGLLLNGISGLDGRHYGVLSALLGIGLLVGMVFSGYQSARALGGLLTPEPTLILSPRGMYWSMPGAGAGKRDMIRWRDIREARLFTSGGRRHLGLVLTSYEMVCIAEEEVHIPLADLCTRIEANRRRDSLRSRRPAAALLRTAKAA